MCLGCCPTIHPRKMPLFLGRKREHPTTLNFPSTKMKGKKKRKLTVIIKKRPLKLKVVQMNAFYIRFIRICSLLKNSGIFDKNVFSFFVFCVRGEREKRKESGRGEKWRKRIMGRKSLEVELIESFDRSQRTAAAHPGEVQRLSRLHDENPTEFVGQFVKLVNHVLPVAKKEKSAENIVKFVIMFATHDREHQEQSGFAGSNFYLFLIEYLLEYLECKDRGVRLRCCQILSGLLKALGEDASLPTDLFDAYLEKLLRRTYDKFPDVRTTGTGSFFFYFCVTKGNG